MSDSSHLAFRLPTSPPDAFLVHYHEIGLKGGNRPAFVRVLVANIRSSLSGLDVDHVTALYDRILIRPGRADPRKIACLLARIPGVSNVMPAFETPRDIGAISERAVSLTRECTPRSFRVSTVRSDKEFPLDSDGINRAVGSAIEKALKIPVRLDDPDCTVAIRVLSEHCYIAFEKILGVRGLPVETSGSAISLLSGGIDSPVASYLMMTRGLRLQFVHFHSFPFLGRASQEKAEELARVLGAFQQGAVLHLSPIGEAQRTVIARVPAKFRVLMYRRVMLRLAAAIAARERAGALVTGENLGQVASQTLENIAAVGAVSSLLVFRPLVGLDKIEIINRARAIGTYEISIRPDQDCCTLFMPRHPATRSSASELDELERNISVADLVQETLDRTERRRVVPIDACGAIAHNEGVTS